MKSKILKLCPVVLLFLIMGASCQNDEWEDIILNDKTCSDVNRVLDSFSDYSGTVKNLYPVNKTNIYCIVVTGSGTSNELYYVPCNLPEQYLKDGLEIKFSGNFLDVKDWVEGEIQTSLIGSRVQLSNAKIKKQ